MNNHQATLGKISYWSSIAGIIVPVCLGVLLVGWIIFFVQQGRMGPSYEDQVQIIFGAVVCLVLFLVLELVAVSCGIAARRTATGQTGLAISGVLLTFGLAVTAFVLYRADFFRRF